MIYKQYLSQFQNTQEVEKWLNNIKDIDKKDQDEVEHIIDYFMKKLWYISIPEKVYRHKDKLLFWKWHFWELEQSDFKYWIKVHLWDYKWSEIPDVDVITGNATFIN